MPNQRRDILKDVYGFNGPSRLLWAWDMYDFAWNKSIFGAHRSCPNTVSSAGRVYMAEEVNFFLWGVLNGLAAATSSSPNSRLTIGKYPMAVAVRAHRSINNWDSRYPGDAQGRLAWANAGYNAAVNGFLVPPASSALLNCTPRVDSWQPLSPGLSYHVGGVTGVNPANFPTGFASHTIHNDIN